jgi:hypothetical protein
MRGHVLALMSVCTLLVGATAISAADEELGTVEGTVTFRGKPLTDATIKFHLKDDQFVGAKIKDGKYRVDRVPAGKVKVTIESKTLPLPAKFADEEKSLLIIEVKKGKNDANVDLSD